MGSSCAPECCERRRTGPIGLPDPAPASPFPDRPRGLPAVSVRRTLSHPAHPLVRFALPPEFLEPAPVRSPCPDAFPGLSSLIATSSGGVHVRERPRLASFRPRRFSRPRRLAPPPTFAGLFHPAATSRVRSSGSSPREKPHELVARRCPPAVCPPLLPDFKGGARTSCPSSGLFSTRESVAARSGLGRALLATLLSFLFPRVLLRSPRQRPSPPAPTTAFEGPRRVHDARPRPALASLPPPSEVSGLPRLQACARICDEAAFLKRTASIVERSDPFANAVPTPWCDARRRDRRRHGRAGVSPKQSQLWTT